MPRCSHALLPLYLRMSKNIVLIHNYLYVLVSVAVGVRELVLMIGTCGTWYMVLGS